MAESSVLVHPDAARRQIDAESQQRLREYAPGDGGESRVGEGTDRIEGVRPGDGEGDGKIVDSPIPPEPAEARSTSFHGVVEIDPARLSGNAGAISQEVVQRLASTKFRKYDFRRSG